jgi:hypothetical protein
MRSTMRSRKGLQLHRSRLMNVCCPLLPARLFYPLAVRLVRLNPLLLIPSLLRNCLLYFRTRFLLCFPSDFIRGLRNEGF